MNKFLALTAAALGLAGTASAQVFSPAQPMPSQVVPASGTMMQTPGIVQSGAYLPATVTGGVVTGQPYNLTPSVMGGTVVGMPRMTGNVYSQPFTTTSSGGTVVGGSYLANGPVFSPTNYPVGMTYPQPVMTGSPVFSTPVGNQMMGTSAPVGYSSVPFGYSSSPVMTAGPTGFVTRVVNVPVRTARRLFRR